MSRLLHVLGAVSCSCVVAVLCAGPAAAASSPDSTAPDSTPAMFIDLTQGGAAPASSASDPANVSGAAFIDLTGGRAPTAIPDAGSAASGAPPRRRFVDLSNGLAVPAFVESEEPGPDESNRVTIIGDRIADPYEESNRGRFRTHVGLHRYLIDPVERTYFVVVPVPARDGLHNFLTNLETPAVLANNLFQGRFDRAGDTLSRFVVNTTIGIGGIFDFAGKAGIAYRDDDFGATLASYGVSDSPYLLVPVIGPSNPRDLGGKVVDFLIDPLHWVTVPGGILTSAAHTGLHELDKRSVDAGELDALARSSPDAYAEERAKARARRAAELSDAPLPPR